MKSILADNSEGIMKSSFTKRFALCLILMLAVVGCTQKLAFDEQANSRVFKIENEYMTDGVLEYRYLPRQWNYFGKYPYKIGTVQNGNTIYTSDKNGTVAQEAKSLLQDMEYRPWVLTSVELPDVPDETCGVRIAFFSGHSIFLSSEAHNEFMSWYGSGKPKPIGVTQEKPFAHVFFTAAGMPELQYDSKYCIVQGEDHIVIIDNSDLIIGLFNCETAFYREVTRG